MIIGATSAIAEATARVFAARGDSLFLVARDADRLRAIAADLGIRGAAAVDFGILDVRDPSGYEPIIAAAQQALGGLDAALIAHGTLSDQQACEQSVDQLLEQFTVNAQSVMGLCTLLGNRFEAQGSGTLAVISSVAGDRGRRSNYVYGAAKAAVTAFASGMRQRLYSKGVRVITVKPGFVDTPMTAAFKKGPLWASRDTVGGAIARAMDRGTPVLYTPGFWRPIMGVIRLVPESLFRKLRL
jgi:short-subunit dehydrogenase